MADIAVASEAIRDASSPRVEANQQLQSSSSEASGVSHAGEEQALESHEVIELQTFSERKAWIEEKIKFLEALPPIEVFVGLDAIRVSAEEVPGLPTRAQLQQWVIEHDAIEKETEVFDTGELKKLRQLTKAATQRNLSPEDTDVIELTLTTIYELDKLLHLLRDRSENLEMMGIRLTWEENRQTGWKERRQIIEDLHAFSLSRARWNPSIYDLSPKKEDSSDLPRRGSITSQASANSDNAVYSPAFSRAARFKLAELLSRDAAQFSGRVTSLRHGKVTAAGKALDKLIDHSRKPVPEELLDEQDRLEEKCINAMENIGKFTMSLVMQWRKADEIYVETMKDHATASNLLEEIETAKLYHPTVRQSTSFISRIDTILKRLTVRGDPASPANLFPRPEHPLFPDQTEANQALVQTLSADIATASKLARKVDLAAKEYRTTYEAVKRAEALLQSINELSTTLTTINKKFKDGVSSGDDGSPPDLMSEHSLDPTSHSVFLALFPSLLEETALAIDSSDRHLRGVPSVLFGLNLPGIDQEFRENAAAHVHNLSSLREETTNLRDSISKRVARLRESRKISSSIGSKLALLKAVRAEIVTTMERDRWQQELGSPVAPPTPESPTMDLSTPNSADANFENQLAQVSSGLKSDVMDPLDKLCATLETPMQTCLRQKASVLQSSIEGSYQMLRLLGSIKEQSSVMNFIRDNFHRILVRIEDSKIHITDAIEAVLKPEIANIDSNSADTNFDDLEQIQKEVAMFIDALSSQVPFVARHSVSSVRTTSLKSPLSPSNSKWRSSQSGVATEVPFDLASIDASVRADSNSYAMRLNGGMENLLQSRTHFDLAMMVKGVDAALSSTMNDINGVVQELSAYKSSFATISRKSPETVDNLQAVLDALEAARSKRSKIARSLSPIRDLLRQMDDKSRSLAPSIRESLYLSRNRAVDDAELRLNTWDDEVGLFKNAISSAIEAERRYLEELRAAEERRCKEEGERLAAEQAERLRLERERLENKEKQRLLEEKLAEERRQEQERQGIAAELAERERLEREAVEAERLRCQEEEKRLEAARIQAEQDRLAKEEEERARIEQERLEMLKKLRAAEAQLKEERRQHAESERTALELAKKQQLEMEELARRQSERQRLEEEYSRREESRRLELERERLEKEEKERTQREKEDMEQREREEMEGREREEVEKRRQQEEEKRVGEEMERREREEMERRKRQEEEKRVREEMEKKDRKEWEHKEQSEREAKEQREEEERAQREKEERELKEKEEKEARANQEVERKKRQEREWRERELKELKQKEEKAKKEQEQREKAEKMKKNRIDKGRHRVESVSRQDKGNTQKSPVNSQVEDVFDVFGVQKTSSDSRAPLSQDLMELQAQVLALRKRLRSICINEAVRPTKSSTELPREEQLQKMTRDLLAVSTDTQKLPSGVEDANLNGELVSLRTEIEGSSGLLKELQKLVDLHKAVQVCDAALSDLLEHIDSYPAIPLGVLSSKHKSSPTAPPEEQMSARLAFAREAVEDLGFKFVAVAKDRRAVSEYSRIQQTWSELHEMAMDRIGGKKSRPGSVVSSSGRNSSASTNQPLPTHSRGARKVGSYSHLSVSSVSIPGRGKMLAPPPPTHNPRRTVSGSTDAPSRSTSRLSSVSTNRSVSGPLNSSLYGSTFASRQRTSSLSTPNSISTPGRRPSLTPSRFRLNSEGKRSGSPTMSMSEHSSHSNSRSAMAPSRTSVNSSTWSRAPRNSFSSILPRVMTPQRKASVPVRKKYVADPKSKLDMAVGDVVNQLSVGINVEGITESWRDQSGKYWIGNQEPKLCFCRILRSQTVMVRVGGGWTELSKFIKDHCAESFRIAPESPPRFGGQEEKWISSSVLLEARETDSPPPPPRTPEPTVPFVPSFSLMTPSGQSPQSIKSSPSTKGSPLAPLQFIRRAEPDLSLLRPATPSKTPLRSRVSNANTPSRNSVWRP